MRKSLITVIFAALSANSVIAGVWDLDSCINYAIEHNITLKSRGADKESSEIDVKSAKSSFLPTVSASAAQSWNFGRGLTAENVYANRNTSNTQWGATFNLPLFDGLSSIRQLRLARTNLQAMIEQYEATKDDITLNVISSYLQVLYCDEIRQVAAQQVELSEHELLRRQALLDAGKIPEIDMLEASSLLAQDKLSETQAQNDYTLALIDLGQLLELDNIDGFCVAPIKDEHYLLMSADNVYQNALSYNHSIKAAELNVKAAEDNISVAQTGYIPKLSFNAGLGSSYYTVTGFNNDSFSKQMKDNFNTYLGFSLNIPIFDAFSTKNNVKKARVQHITAQLQLDDAKKTVYKAIQQAYYQAEGAKEKVAASIIAEDAASKSFEAMSEKYNLGRASTTDYEQAKTKALKATAERIQAKYEYILRCRILEFYSKQ